MKKTLIFRKMKKKKETYSRNINVYAICWAEQPVMYRITSGHDPYYMFFCSLGWTNYIGIISVCEVSPRPKKNLCVSPLIQSAYVRQFLLSRDLFRFILSSCYNGSSSWLIIVDVIHINSIIPGLVCKT